MRPSSRRFWIGAFAGVIATLVMSVVMMLGFALAPHQLAEPLPFALLARVIARVLHRDAVDIVVVILAIPLHFAYGAIWAACAAWSARITWPRGVVVGLGMWLIMAIFLLPLAGDATFSVVSSPIPWVLTLILHIVYGGTFGGIVDRMTRSHVPRGDPETVAHGVHPTIGL